MVLYRVVYDRPEFKPIALHKSSVLDYNVDRWCEEHCQGRYYPNPDSSIEKFIEFEDTRDAMWFALKYGKYGT